MEIDLWIRWIGPLEFHGGAYTPYTLDKAKLQ